MLQAALYIASYKWNIDKIRLAASQDRREFTRKVWARLVSGTQTFSGREGLGTNVGI